MSFRIFAHRLLKGPIWPGWRFGIYWFKFSISGALFNAWRTSHGNYYCRLFRLVVVIVKPGSTLDNLGNACDN